MANSETVQRIARVAHEANRGYQAAWPTPGIPVAPPWDEFPRDQQLGIIAGVELALTGVTPEQSHASWLRRKVAEGWVYGDVKDADAQPPTHPCMLPYEDLPPEQKLKDHLFLAIVHALGLGGNGLTFEQVVKPKEDEVVVIRLAESLDHDDFDAVLRLLRGVFPAHKALLFNRSDDQLTIAQRDETVGELLARLDA